MQRTIKATGRGNMAIAPDTTRIMISVEKIYADYETTVKKSAEHTGQLREAITRAGLDPKDLKTTRFNINSEYEGYRDDNDDWRQRFVGFKYEHAMNIEFPIDNEVLGRVLYQLMQCPVKVEFNIGYTVRNADAVRTELLSRAVQRAKADAEVIAKTAGVKLGEIITMDHTWSQLEIYSDVMKMNEPLICSADCVREESLTYDIEPDDIHLDDTVTVVWEIA